METLEIQNNYTVESYIRINVSFDDVKKNVLKFLRREKRNIKNAISFSTVNRLPVYFPNLKQKLKNVNYSIKQLTSLSINDLSTNRRYTTADNLPYGYFSIKEYVQETYHIFDHGLDRTCDTDFFFDNLTSENGQLYIKFNISALKNLFATNKWSTHYFRNKLFDADYFKKIILESKINLPLDEFEWVFEHYKGTDVVFKFSPF